MWVWPQFPPKPVRHLSLAPLKPGLDGVGEAVLGVDLVVSHVEQYLQQPLLLLRLRHGLGLLPPFILRLPRSLKQSVPGLRVWAQSLLHHLIVESPGSGRVTI